MVPGRRTSCSTSCTKGRRWRRTWSCVLQYAFNDVDDSRLHGGFRLIDSGVALRDDLQHPPFWRAPLLALRDTIANRSLLFYLLYRALAGARPQPASAADAPPLAPGADAPPVSNPGAILVGRLAAELVHAVNAIGAPVIALTIPAPLYASGGDAVYDQVVAALRTLVAGTPNQLLVTDPLLAEAQQRGEPPFLANDGHLMSAAGHRLVAEALARAVLRYDARE